MKIGRLVKSLVNRVLDRARSLIMKKVVIQHEKIKITDLYEVHMVTTSLDVEVTSHDEPYFDIMLKTYEDGPELKIKKEDNLLEIAAFKPNQKQTFFGLLPSTKLQVFVPPALAKIWDFRTGSGDISFSKINTKKLTIHTGSGDIHLSDLEAEQIKTQCASGDLKVHNVQVENCQLNSSSGDMVFRRLHARNIIAEVSSGDILFSELQGEHLDVQMASGDVKLKNIQVNKGSILSRSGDIDGNHVKADMFMLNTVTGDIEMDNFSGSLNGTITSGDLNLRVIDECTVNLDAINGDIIVSLENDIASNATIDITCDVDDLSTNLPLQAKDDSKGLSGVTGEGKNTIRIHSDSGDVRVKVKEFVQV